MLSSLIPLDTYAVLIKETADLHKNYSPLHHLHCLLPTSTVGIAMLQVLEPYTFLFLNSSTTVIIRNFCQLYKLCPVQIICCFQAAPYNIPHCSVDPSSSKQLKQECSFTDYTCRTFTGILDPSSAFVKCLS